MRRKHSVSQPRSPRRRAVLAGTAAAAISAALPLRFAHGANGKLKIGIIMPRTGAQAQGGIDAQRGADVAYDVLKDKGYAEPELMLGDSENNPQIARVQAERLIEAGAHVLSGCFDSGATMTVAQVAEQKGIPFVVNIAVADAITEQGYKTVFRAFPTGMMFALDAFALQKELFKVAGRAPKTMVMLHVNDTFGTPQRDLTVKLVPQHNMPYTIVETIGYDPMARDLSAEVRKAKATNAELVWLNSRVNDSILIIQEMVKQRWEPMGIFNTGPGSFQVPFMQALGKLSDDVITFAPWYDPNKPMAKALEAAFLKRFPDRLLNLSHAATFEAVLIALDAYKRAGSTEPAKLIEALRKTDLKDNTSIGPGVRFNDKGQCPDTRIAGIQNRGGKNVIVVPVTAANAKPIWPQRPWRERG